MAASLVFGVVGPIILSGSWEEMVLECTHLHCEVWAARFAHIHHQHP
jgi:hypothetical protein